MSRLEDQIRRLTEVMDSMAPSVEDLMPSELADELDLERRPSVEVRIPIGGGPRRPRFRVPGWAWGLAGAVAVAVVAVPLLLSINRGPDVADQPSTTVAPGSEYALTFDLSELTAHGDGWLPNAEITATMPGTPFPTMTTTSDSNGTFSVGPFEGCCETNLTVSDGATTLTFHIPWTVSIWRVDPSKDVVAGTVNDNRAVHVSITGGPDPYETVIPASETVDGNWLLELEGLFDILPGMRVEATVVTDELAFVTHSTTRIDPGSNVELTYDRIEGGGFEPNGLVEISIDGVPVPDGIVVDRGGFFRVDLGPYDVSLEPGTDIFMTDGTSMLSGTVPVITFDVLDESRGLASGTSDNPDGAEVEVLLELGPVGASDQDEQVFARVTVTDGAWRLAFDPPPPGRQILGALVTHLEEGIAFQVHFPLD